MQAVYSFKLSHDLGICNNWGRHHRFSVQKQCHWSIHIPKRLQFQRHALQYRYYQFRCNSLLTPSQPVDIPCIKNAVVTLTRPCNYLQISSLFLKLIPAVGTIVFGIWGLGPLLHQSRNVFLQKSDSSWGKSGTYRFMTSYLQPLVLWTGAMLFCRALDPMVLPTEASQIVKQRLLNFIRSLSTVLAFAYCLSSVIQQVQKFFMATIDPTDTRNMGFQFAGTAVYSAVWIAAVSLFMELLGFSTQKLLTAGGLGTVFLTLAGREILTNFLSGIMIHATRPFVVNDVIKTKIEGCEVSGAVEHIGWWSPTIIRGEDREAVYIPNHQFTVNIVRNLSRKSHWRIKTHLAISHLDFSKINNIVADMRKVLAKNPQIEQKKLHKRVFLDNINPENQALMILVSCFVKTSRAEEYLSVKEAILLDLLRVIRHHQARLATPIHTLQRVSDADADLGYIPYVDPAHHGAASDKKPGIANGVAHSTKDHKGTNKSSSDAEQHSNATLKAISKTDQKSGGIVSSSDSGDPQDISVNKLLKKLSRESVLSANSSATLPDSRRREALSSQPSSKPALEDNIVLGVALQGSKQTLPIKEGTKPSPYQAEAKELAISHSSNGSIVAKPDKQENHQYPDSQE
ncbi:PREDICTED: mechanosensitive ion channel protein 2, chloroplastic-like [Ipomoea nil]|uniref:mechanosensitive ion channel protein 2, chloroplastic-like n=1 Tax=Ipomoea nil TaxID=35883 RepID=UPI0009019D03|nr:PREDICTED: mechanosensitive ion channel protein 2, chloroplastic-like [Ipomoea nil]XP_019177359.1 PREDICTED: mechanosensitive ion channel protein 2, chloroplastic-like [Ipomoea nil]